MAEHPRPGRMETFHATGGQRYGWESGTTTYREMGAWGGRVHSVHGSPTTASVSTLPRPSTSWMNENTGAVGRMKTGIREGAQKGRALGARATAVRESMAAPAAPQIPQVQWGSQIQGNAAWMTPGPSSPLPGRQASFQWGQPLAGAQQPPASPKPGIRGAASRFAQHPMVQMARAVGSMAFNQ
jgi:hypothetical protein